MAVDVVTHRIIRRDRASVSSFAADPGNAPSWYENIRSVEWLTPPRLAVGSKVAFVAYFLGKRLAYTYEIVAFEPGKMLVMRTSEGPFPMETSYRWEDAGSGDTRMTLRNRGRPHGFSRLVAPFMAMAMRRANTKDLAKLASLLERD